MKILIATILHIITTEKKIPQLSSPPQLKQLPLLKTKQNKHKTKKNKKWEIMMAECMAKWYEDCDYLRGLNVFESSIVTELLQCK